MSRKNQVAISFLFAAIMFAIGSATANSRLRFADKEVRGVAYVPLIDDKTVIALRIDNEHKIMKDKGASCDKHNFVIDVAEPIDNGSTKRKHTRVRLRWDGKTQLRTNTVETGELTFTADNGMGGTTTISVPVALCASNDPDAYMLPYCPSNCCEVAHPPCCERRGLFRRR